MDRGASAHLSWMLLPVCAILALAALSLPRQPYTGLLLRGDWVARVEPQSPAARIGLVPGDRVLRYPPSNAGPQNPLATAVPGRPLVLLRERAHRLDEVTLVPVPLPVDERRWMALLLAVASGFVVLGGWVWSERRDQLTRTFFLMCLAFACLIAPFPRFGSPTASLIYETIYSGISVFLPALLVHFFALFPRSDRARGAAGRLTSASYGVAIALFGVVVLLALAPLVTRKALEPAQEFLQSIAALWFAAGAMIALALFLRSYFLASDEDARRRLRVALAGTLLGVGPLAAVVLLRNLFPGVSLPGERGAVVLTLLVPASFAWAAGVHRVFEIGMALRAGAILALLGLMAALVYVAGEWLAAAWRPDLGSGIAGGALAFVAFVAAIAGPAAAWLRALGERVVPLRRERSPLEILELRGDIRRGPADALLLAGCEAVAEWLRLDGCAAIELSGPPRLVARAGRTRAPDLDAAAATQLRALPETPGAVADALIEEKPRQALEAAGVSWIAPLGHAPARAALLLGHRLGGPWLSVPEVHELERFAAHLEVLIENVTLRAAATMHGAMDRELSRAHAIQLHLLPRRAPLYPSLDCAAAALSSEPVGGDYYDFVKAPGRVLTLAVGDAAGKGVPAALMGVWAQACFRNEARRGAGPGQVLTALNRELVSMEQPEAFVALACMRIEVRPARLIYANAGLTPPLVRRADGTVLELTESGVLLGITPQAQYVDTAVDLEAGDIVVLYTDGLTEARQGDEMFGTERLAEALEGCAERRASDIVRTLLQAVRAFSDQPLDDVTIVVLKQTTVPVRSAIPALQKTLKWRPAPADVTG
ncbi:MAG TPA: SpoIIE family protein phosphatase [Candidatus Udaeobacter sp.]|jgi:serine phosphatase RsbU (regulator of sigma subunit)|nr:SpoIIE family protein phosphatase [Candidatus Udaeobacter sp.]